MQRRRPRNPEYMFAHRCIEQDAKLNTAKAIVAERQEKYLLRIEQYEAETRALTDTHAPGSIQEMAP